MRFALALAAFTGVMVAPASSAEGSGADHPRVALSVSPAQLSLFAPGSRRIRLRNDGAERIVVDATRRTVGSQRAASPWLQLVPARLLLRAGESAMLTLRSRAPRRAEPGEHQVLVLLTTRPLRGGRVHMQVRLGVRVRMVVAGRVVRRLTFAGLRVHRSRGARFIFVSVANRGNVTLLLRGHVRALLFQPGQRVARLRPRVRGALLPGARAVLALPYRSRVRGPVIAVVRIRLGPGIRVVERRYHVRL